MNIFCSVEIEATNFCNARCEFCNNNDSARLKGFLEFESFDLILSKLDEIILSNLLYLSSEKNFKPKIVFGGLGEPLLHPNIDKLVSLAKGHGYYVALITNGKLLNFDMARRLIKSNIDEIDISLHTVNSNKELAITGLMLNYEHIKDAIKIFKTNEVHVEMWRILSLCEQNRDDAIDAEKYALFVAECGLTPENVLGPSLAWSRDEKVRNSQCDIVSDDVLWCHKVVFTFNIDWEGNVVLCCADYCRESVVLGNILKDGFDFNDYFSKIMDIAEKKEFPEICKSCKRWKDLEYKEIEKNYNLNFEEIWKNRENGGTY